MNIYKSILILTILLILLINSIGCTCSVNNGMVALSEGDTRAVTLVVAAFDSLHPEKADYLCDGFNDQVDIQAALDALPATGGEVRLLDGLYHCEATINLDNSQTLRGCGRNTVLTTNTDDIVFLSAVGIFGFEIIGITISDLTIDGNTIGDIGIYFEYVNYSSVKDVCIRNNQSATGGYLTGIYMLNSNYNSTINSILIDNSGTGIYLDTCSSNSISTCTIQSSINTAGIRINNGNNNIINNNTLLDNNRAIDIITCNNNTITSNLCETSTQDGISISGGSLHNTISGNIVLDNKASGIIIDTSSYNSIFSNSCNGNLQIGIMLSGALNNTVSGNICHANLYGINFSDSSYNIISGNTCFENTFNGITATDSSYNNITSNTCAQNEHDGLTFQRASHNSINSNVCLENSQNLTNTYDDIYVYSNSDYNNIQSNTCRAGVLVAVPRYGINIADNTCDGNLVTNNDIYNDGFGTGTLNDAGTATVTAAGNR